MLADFIFVCVILLMGIAVCLVGYFSTEHCKKLGVTFKDFYFGTPRYDRAAERYKKEKAKNKCKCQNDRGIKYICKKCLDKEVNEIIKEPKVNDVLNPKFKIGQRIVTKEGVEGQVVLIFCTHPFYTYYCSMYPGADSGYEYVHCIDLNIGCLLDGSGNINTLNALNKYTEDQLEECIDEA